MCVSFLFSCTQLKFDSCSELHISVVVAVNVWHLLALGAHVILH